MATVPATGFIGLTTSIIDSFGKKNGLRIEPRFRILA